MVKTWFVGAVLLGRGTGLDDEGNPQLFGVSLPENDLQPLGATPFTELLDVDEFRCPHGKCDGHLHVVTPAAVQAIRAHNDPRCARVLPNHLVDQFGTRLEVGPAPSPEEARVPPVPVLRDPGEQASPRSVQGNKVCGVNVNPDTLRFSPI